MTIHTSNIEEIRPFVLRMVVPGLDSHKGQNGKVLVTGGSSLFHASIIWSATIASHFVDMVHFASTSENNEVITRMKVIFGNGIVVPRCEIDWYAREDDAILIGPGMMRNEQLSPKGRSCSGGKIDNGERKRDSDSLKLVLEHGDEGDLTAHLTHYVLTNFSQKQIVLDAGALQMMDPAWLVGCDKKPILTPHQGEFARLFGVDVSSMPLVQKAITVKEFAHQYNCIIMLKAVVDIVSDGEQTIEVHGGNVGLTKGGTGDILAGLTTALAATNNPLVSCVMASYVLKRASESLFGDMGTWYNNDDLMSAIPKTLHRLRGALELV